MMLRTIKRPYGILSVMECEGIGDAIQACERSPRAGSYMYQMTESYKEKSIKGDESLVPASTKYLNALELKLPSFNLKTWERINSIVGNLPNIPAYLSGEPVNMIQRKRIAKQETPLIIYLDLTGSSYFFRGGSVNDEVASRGAVMLALVRFLSLKRPTQLYIGGFLGSNLSNKASVSVIKIDTNPLDLARAAFLLSSDETVSRIVFPLTAYTDGGYGGSGWAWNVPRLEHERAPELLKELFGADNILYIGAAYSNDPLSRTLSNDPVAWLVSMIQKYGDPTHEDDK